MVFEWKNSRFFQLRYLMTDYLIWSFKTSYSLIIYLITIWFWSSVQGNLLSKVKFKEFFWSRLSDHSTVNQIVELFIQEIIIFFLWVGLPTAASAINPWKQLDNNTFDSNQNQISHSKNLKTWKHLSVTRSSSLELYPSFELKGLEEVFLNLLGCL